MTRLLSLAAAALILVPQTAAAQSPPPSTAAVAEVNGDLTIGYLYNSVNDASSTTLQSYGATAMINLPLWKLVGASIALNASRSRIELELAKLALGEDFKDGWNAWGAAGSIFVRDPTIGRIRATYSDTLSYRQATSHRYGIDGEYYFAQWTLGAGVARRPVDIWFAEERQERITLTNYVLSAAAYPIDEVRIDAGYESEDSGPWGDRMNGYRIGVEYQPAFLGNRVSGGLRYQRLDSTPSTNVYGVTLTWFFGAQPDLKTRDRYYR